MINFNIVAISALNTSKRTKEVIELCSEVLINKGIKVVLSNNLSNLSLPKVPCRSDAYILANADILIAIGGDGTMLHLSKRFGSHGLPVLGINLGNLGFLTDISPENLTTSINDLLSGSFRNEKRIFLEARAMKQKFLALNEMIIHSGAIAKMIEYELYVDKNFVFRQKADGLIISTSTGSTAYSLSAGGPIIHPLVDAIVVQPMFPHNLSSRSLIITSKSSVQIRITGKNSRAKLNHDGNDALNLSYGDSIKIYKSKSELILLHPKEHDFYSSCREKLGWSATYPKKD